MKKVHKINNCIAGGGAVTHTLRPPGFASYFVSKVFHIVKFIHLNNLY